MMTLIMAVIGACFWMAGLVLAINILFTKESYHNLGDTVGASIMALIVFGMFGGLCNISGWVFMDKVTSTTYIPPTSIVKTNNVTLAHYIKDGAVVARLESRCTDYWNSTNIMVEVTSGVNLHGNKVSDKYEIVIKENK